MEILGGNVRIAKDDCFNVLSSIADESIDMVLTDLPYGTTHAPWDKLLDHVLLFEHFWRVLKKNGVVVIFAQFPFACKLILEESKTYRYKWVWKKNNNFTGFLNAKKMPLRNHEDILVFYRALPTYNPQFRKGFLPYSTKRERKKEKQTSLYNLENYTYEGSESKTGDRYPLDVIDCPSRRGRNYHPTQKPVELLRYLIRTYTNPGEIILDPTMGSGSTGVAAIKEGRCFVGVELEKGFFDVAKQRIINALGELV